MAEAIGEGSDTDELPGAPPPGKRVRVRCLGPSPLKGEHTFLSADPTRDRICRFCRRQLEALRLGRRWEAARLSLPTAEWD